jgi:hypothetical protein
MADTLSFPDIDAAVLTPTLTAMKISHRVNMSDVFRVSLLNSKEKVKFVHFHNDKRSITIAYKVIDFSPCDVEDHIVVNIQMAGCIKSYYPDDVQWSKHAHVQTARSRLEKYPMYVVVKVPSYSREEVIVNLFRGLPRMTRLMERNAENDRLVDKKYVAYAWRFIEKKLRRGLRNGVCDRVNETLPQDIYHKVNFEEVD